MSARTTTEYKMLRKEYLPEHLRCVIIAESPPKSGKYFYDPEGRSSEPLYRALMKDVLQFVKIPNRAKGLRAFQDAGFVLVDATYTPIDGIRPGKKRDAVIQMDYPSLVTDLIALMGNTRVPVLLIKANVCQLLNAPLVADGLSVLNNGEILPFPSSGQQGRFAAALPAILSRL